MGVERRRILQIDVVAGIRHHDQRRGRNVLLHQDAGLEARPILVPGHDQRWHVDGFHLVDQFEQRWPPLLHTAHG